MSRSDSRGGFERMAFEEDVNGEKETAMKT